MIDLFYINTHTVRGGKRFLADLEISFLLA